MTQDPLASLDLNDPAHMKIYEDFLRSLPEDDRQTLMGQVQDHHEANAGGDVEALFGTTLPGPQTIAATSDAHVIGYGGAAGGGKTRLAIGLAGTEHRRTLFLRKEAAQLQGVKDEIADILGTTKGFNSQTGVWNIQNTAVPRQIRFGGLNNPGDERKYQGSPRDLLVLDEACNIPKSQVDYVMGWTRTTVPGQRCRVLMCTNPPTDASIGGWFIDYFGPWLDPEHPNPAKSGEIRWYAAIDGEDTEVDSNDQFEHDGETISPYSKTFIQSKVTDNPYLMGTSYYTTLQAMPEPLRSQMLHGDFLAGVEDNVWQTIPTAWVRAAQDRWTEDVPSDDSAPLKMLSCGVDVSRGGRDESVIAPLYASTDLRTLYFATLDRTPGILVPDGPTLGAASMRIRRDGATMVVDAIGVGSSVVDYYEGNSIKHNPFTGSKGTKERDATGVFKLKNSRTASWWKLREALDPHNTGRVKVALPKDSKLLADLTAPKYSILEGDIIKVESKPDVAKRLKRSTDSGDAVVYAHVECYMGGFEGWGGFSSGYGANSSGSFAVDTSQFT